MLNSATNGATNCDKNKIINNSIMVSYTCEKCNKIFDRKFLFDRHINRKTDCTNSGSKTSKPIDHKCKKCKKNFSRKDSLNRHLKICKCSVSNSNNNSASIKGNNNKNSIVGNNNLALNECKNFSINVVVFTKDGIQSLTPQELSNMFKSNNNLFESMIHFINFNPNKPQHHNVYYPDMKSSYGVVYENKKWVMRKINEILDMLLDAKIEDLNEILNEMGDFLSKKTRQKIRETIEGIDYSKPGYRKKLITYLKPILYNNKDIIIKTRKMTESNETVDLDDINDKPIKKVKKSKKVILDDETDDETDDEVVKKPKNKVKKD